MSRLVGTMAETQKSIDRQSQVLVPPRELWRRIHGCQGRL